MLVFGFFAVVHGAITVYVWRLSRRSVFDGQPKVRRTLTRGAAACAVATVAHVVAAVTQAVTA